MRVAIVLSLSIVLASCDGAPAEPGPARFGIFARPAERHLAESIALLLPEGSAVVRERVDPLAALDEAEDELAVALAPGDACAECYALEVRAPRRIAVRGGGALGLQYGLANALEAHGVRFFHPWRTAVPAGPLTVVEPLPDRVVEPEMGVRGLQLHTLHPIEALFAMWERGEDAIPSARRIFAWIVANRGNAVAWSALDEIIHSPAEAAGWREHTAQLLEIAHGLGLHVGLGVQLFGESNLQFAFDLIEGDGDYAAQIEERLDVLGDLPFDSLKVSFGEFSGIDDPAELVDTLDLFYDIVQRRWPGREVSASIHVGADLRVEWMGEDILYYFLATRGNPEIVPWIHTVMYYGLVGSAGGAYHHEDFSEHFDLLIDLLRAGRAVAYYPESAYWVAFDNTIPTYLPLYVRQRWADLDAIRARTAAEGVPPLDQHVTFSSGWEWGYWQNDVAVLRTSHTLPARWEDVFREMLAPWGEGGAEAAEAIADLTRAQHTGLIEERLAAWIASRDATFDLGDAMGIVSQPTRPSYATIAAMSAEERAAFAAEVVGPLEQLASLSEAARMRLASSGAPLDEPFFAELVDGFEVDVARARFAGAALEAVLAFADRADASAPLARMEAAMDEARAAVSRRHASLHDPSPRRLTARFRSNATLYDYGYLREADQLCFWARERAQVRNLVLGESSAVPLCVF